MLVLVGTIAAIVAALGTIIFGLKSLTKNDLKRIEKHVGETAEHLRQQGRRDNLDARAQGITFAVSGEAPFGQAQALHLTVSDESASVRRVGLFNEHQNNFGFVECTRAESGNGFAATVDAETFRRWMDGAFALSWNKTRAIVRAYLVFDGEQAEVYREIVVSLAFVDKQLRNSSERWYRIEGSA